MINPMFGAFLRVFLVNSILLASSHGIDRELAGLEGAMDLEEPGIMIQGTVSDLKFGRST